MQSSRWLRTNNLETYYEWVIPFDKNLNMIEDFQNGYFKQGTGKASGPVTEIPYYPEG